MLLYYRHLVGLEFKDRTPNEVYELSFSRLLKMDAAKAVWPARYASVPLMLGTDERDLFIPIVRQILSQVSEGARVLDIGAGDGQTVGNFIDGFPPETIIDIIEPNKAYANSYASMISQHHRITLRNKLTATFKEFLGYTKNRKKELYDVILCLHSVYFIDEMNEFIRFLDSSLKPGGSAIIVFADEEFGYTGRVYHNYLKNTNPSKASQFLQIVRNRKRVLLEQDVISLTTGKLKAIRKDMQEFEALWS